MKELNLTSTLQQKNIKEELMKYNILHLWIFGSQARGDSNESSDVDLMYEKGSLKNNSNWGPIGAYSYIKDLIKKDIDFVNIDYIDPLIKQQVMKDRIQLF